MEQNLEKIEELLALFDSRESLRNACNRKIAALLSPTLLLALFELINVTTENLVWEDMQVIESVLVIRVEVTYDPTKEMSEFLQLISPKSSTDPGATMIQRTFQLGIPLVTVFNDKDQLKQWIVEMARNNHATSSETKPPAPVPAPNHFDVTDLSKEQITQLLFFQQQTKGTSQ